MKYFLIVLSLMGFKAVGETVFIPTPDGYSLLGSFEPKTELEKRAFEAVKTHLKDSRDDIADYYLFSNNLDIANSIYVFKVKHFTYFHEIDSRYRMPYKNGSFHISVQDYSVSFARE